MKHFKVQNITVELPSVHLDRVVKVDLFLPPNYTHHPRYPYKLLLMNDGQDSPQLHLAATLERLYERKVIEPVLVAAIHANKDRIMEYGTAFMPDFKNRGAKAAAYSLFIITELLPFLQKNYIYSTTPTHTAFAGFSLGGLSAFDTAWRFPEVFGCVGVFSGSFWWRSKDLNDNYTDADRITHQMVRQTRKPNGLRIWLQTGTMDERADRNKNGIIDSIDDTLDLLDQLQQKGFRMGQDVRYLQIDGGQHNQETWARAMPDFLKWAFRKKLPVK